VWQELTLRNVRKPFSKGKVVGQFEKKIVMPTKVGIHSVVKNEYLDSRFRGNDKLTRCQKKWKAAKFFVYSLVN